jgi:hypothetical protein
MDLRAEPFVVCNPEIEKGRYFSIQLIAFYTFKYGYIGSRTTGNGAGCYMMAGPGWTGDQPAGIARTFRSETEFSMAIIRTQLFDPADLANVKKIQAGYRALPLSKFLNKAAPHAAPAIAWLPPVNAFWSVTMYDAKTQLLVANPIHRYLISSPMLPHLRTNPDGSLTIYIQKGPPGADRAAS